MVNKKFIYIIFAVMVLAQLFVPLQIIFHQEKILSEGKIVKFKMQPLDPNDPFRGKYVNLSFQENRIWVKNTKNFQPGETIFAKFKIDNLGFIQITSICKTEPNQDLDYLKLKINYLGYDNKQEIFLDFPFNKFYMNENKAQKAEDIYRESNTHIQNNTYAIIAIKAGEAVIKDVMINGVSIKKLSE
ncbi:MAG: GDYXXLXY domain-containing protein [Flavobacterium sp.]|nr:GDYXXLXY domain-containing protein [Flavobacterium sp.]